MNVLQVYDNCNGSKDPPEFLREYYIPSLMEAIRQADSMVKQHPGQTFLVRNSKGEKVYQR